MRVLKQRLLLLSLLSGAFLLAAVFLFLPGKDTGLPGVEILLTTSLTGMCLGIVGICLEAKKLREARLILDNRILYVPSAITEQVSEKRSVRKRSWKNGDVSISCFGVFMDTRVIPFNQKGIQLNGVVLADDCITLAYGAKKKSYSIRIYYTRMDLEELHRIAEIFRYETGIPPAIERSGTTAEFEGGMQ